MNDFGAQAFLQYFELVNTVKLVMGLRVDEHLPAATMGEIRDHIYGLIGTIFACNAAIDRAESQFLREWVGKKSASEVGTMVQHYVTRWNQIRYEMPRFLEQAVEYDLANGTRSAARILACIQAIGAWASLADGDAIEPEREVVVRYCTMLAGDVEKRGVPAVDEDDATSPSTTAPREQSEALPRTGGEALLPSLLKELDALIGLSSVKADVAGLVNLVRIRRLRQEKGLRMPPMSLHLVFTGNPGTGKTTVARLLAKIYQAMGLLSKGHLVETDRSGLVAGFVGQTAIKVAEVVNKATGGVLFIDEAYSLSASKSENDYGREAIDTLLKLMEDRRGDLVVVVAGYTQPMEDFLSANPGLRSRFSKFLHFADYGPQELYDIFVRFCTENHFTFDEPCARRVASLLSARHERRGSDFANARLVRNLFENAISNHANRVATIERPSVSDLETILSEDLPATEA